MDLDRIRDSPIGRLVPIRGVDPRTHRDYDYFAYLPDPLPTRVDLDQETWGVVTEAAGSLGQLRQACAQLPNPQILITPSLAKEAQATSALEGTYGALSDVMEARLPGFEPRSPEIREINAYQQMANLGFTWVQDRPITFRMLCDLQRILAESSVRKPADPGQRRTQQVVIGPEDCTVEEARFVPPPANDQLQAGIEAWQEWVNADHGIPPLVATALAHYQFETLHPFSDGNGRVGRLVILLQLLRAGRLEAPSLSISPWLLKRRDQYQGLLLSTSETGDWRPWVRFFCRAVDEQSRSHVEVAGRLIDWSQGLRRELNDHRWSGVIVSLADDLVDWPVVTNSSIQQQYGVTAPTAQNAIDRLVDVGALEEMTGRSYGRIYGARGIIDLVESL